MKKTNDHSYSIRKSKSLAMPMVKEQIPLFYPKTPTSQSLNLSRQIPSNLSKRKKLFALLEGELNFHGENSSYASHDFHAFAAKFPPQLPREFIRFLTKPGDVVLDPMMGSGTTIVEAFLEGRQGIGLDIDPPAIRVHKDGCLRSQRPARLGV
jgi:DNA modification methylase